MKKSADHVPADKIPERVRHQNTRDQQHDISDHDHLHMPPKSDIAYENTRDAGDQGAEDI